MKSLHLLHLVLSQLLLCISASFHPAALPRADVSPCRLPARNDVYLSVGFDPKNSNSSAPSTGGLKAFLLFVDFPDQPAASSELPQALYDVILPGSAEWYANASYGRLTMNISADTSKFYRMPARADSYGWQRGLTAAAHKTYIQDALSAYGKAIPPTDVFYVMPATSATKISFSPTYMSEVRTKSGVFVAKRATTFGHDTFTAWKYKVLNHETGHTMGLPDLYPLPSGATGLYVGGWDMMGYINGPGPDYFAWNKWRLGWLDDGQVECVSGAGSSVHTISAIEKKGANGDIKAVVVKRNSTAALVAEVRAKIGVDSGLCAEGVLLYTISTAVETGKGSMRVLDANPGTGGCGGDELNDAPLSLRGTSSFTVPGWGVKVTVTDQTGDSYTIRVDVA